ncbi:MAG: zf-HC2 domain-containing protein, partial [Thermodesulfobacteriota bacterium]|nr:zf-HC2 domain-containing protein [Thermodesulfobacteriota bacterium]
MKITCPNEERLADYLEGRLSEEDRSQVEKHLSECDICLEGLVLTNSLVRGRERLDLDPVPDEVTEAAVRLVTSLPATTPRSLMEKLKGSIKNISSAISDDLRPSPWQRWQPSPVRASKTVA